jgi:hypothetical protein
MEEAVHPPAKHRARVQPRSSVGALPMKVQRPPGSTPKPPTAVDSGVAAGLYNAARNEEASKSVRDDYTFLSHTAVAYLMLHTAAAGLGERDTVMLAERGYRDAARMVMEIDRLMPGLVLEELRQDRLQVADVSDACRTMVHDAWRREEPSAESPTAGTVGAAGR